MRNCPLCGGTELDISNGVLVCELCGDIKRELGDRIVSTIIVQNLVRVHSPEKNHSCLIAWDERVIDIVGHLAMQMCEGNGLGDIERSKPCNAPLPLFSNECPNGEKLNASPAKPSSPTVGSTATSLNVAGTLSPKA